MRRFITWLNEVIATRTVVAMSTMWCVYVLLVWSLLPLIFPETRDVVFYVSGGIIQLVALPLIMVGQNLLNRESEERAMMDHLAIMEQLELMKTLFTHTQQQMLVLNDIHDTQDRLSAKVDEIDGELDAAANSASKLGLDGLDDPK